MDVVTLAVEAFGVRSLTSAFARIHQADAKHGRRVTHEKSGTHRYSLTRLSPPKLIQHLMARLFCPLSPIAPLGVWLEY